MTVRMFHFNNNSCNNYLWLLLPPGLEKIEYLQKHENHEIYEKCFEIIQRYFTTEDAEEASLMPCVDDVAHRYEFNVAPGQAPIGGFQLWIVLQTCAIVHTAVFLL